MNEETSKAVTTYLEQILSELRTGNDHAARTAQATAKTATNTTFIRRDASAIRLGKTGPKSSMQEDPLRPVQRQEVEECKQRIRERRVNNPHVSRHGVCSEVLAEFRRQGIKGGYTKTIALNHRVTTELNREDAHLPPY